MAEAVGEKLYDHFRTIMESLGFKCCVSEPFVFFKAGIIIGTYVDDLLCIGRVREDVDLKVALAKCVDVKDLGEVSNLLSTLIERPSRDAVTLSQEGY